MPERPTKRWMDACLAGVGKSGSAVDPGAVCGATWYRKPLSERRAIARQDERGHRRHGNAPTFSPKEARALHALDAFIDDDREMDIRKRPFIDVLRRRIQSGHYNAEAAPVFWRYWVDEAARRYMLVHGGSSPSMFPAELRDYLASVVARKEHERIVRGDYG